MFSYFKNVQIMVVMVILILILSLLFFTIFSIFFPQFKRHNVKYKLKQNNKNDCKQTGGMEYKNMREKQEEKLNIIKMQSTWTKISTLGFTFLFFICVYFCFAFFVITKWNRIYYGELVAHDKV